MDLIVLGVDGVDPELLEKAVERHEMPNWERLRDEAFFCELPSTVPAVTIPAWPSMFSGFDAGKFDAYHLSNPDYENWQVSFHDSSKFQGSFFWDYFRGKVSLHYVPGTSPVYEVNGWMRGGFPSPKDFEFYPETLRNEVEEEVELEVEHQNPRTSKKKIEHELEKYGKEGKIADRMMEKDADVFVSVIRVTDAAAHKAEEADQVLEVYAETDETLGNVLDKAEEEDANLLVASDHGFMRSRQKFNVMDFLEKKGYVELESGENSPGMIYRIVEPLLDTPLKKYLKLGRDLVKDYTGKDLYSSQSNPLDGISKDSKVLPAHFGLGKDCALKIHTEDMPHGRVGEEEREEIVEDIISDLEQVDHDGEKVVEEIWRGKELYSESKHRPEIVFRTSGKTVAETAPSGKVFSKTNSFTHRENGIFYATGPDIDENADSELEIFDVAQLIYALLREPAPSGMRGELPGELVPELEAQERSEVEDIEF
ncbi:MAG: alkaline phosphatase family protein [Candidatus Nanohaloarchaea archaeon]